MFDPKAFEDIAKKSCPIYDFMGLDTLEAENGLFRVRMPLSAETGNHLNIMHASVLFALGEVLGGFVTARHLAKPETFQPVVRKVTIDFKAPALTDIIAETRFSDAQAAEMNAKLDETGKYDFELKSTLTDTNGTEVAQTLGSYAVRNFLGGV